MTKVEKKHNTKFLNSGSRKIIQQSNEWKTLNNSKVINQRYHQKNIVKQKAPKDLKKNQWYHPKIYNRNRSKKKPQSMKQTKKKHSK